MSLWHMKSTWKLLDLRLFFGISSSFGLLVCILHFSDKLWEPGAAQNNLIFSSVKILKPPVV